jgi:hypothetical protein
MAEVQKHVTLTLTHQEFFLIKSAVEELLNDSDLIWGNCHEECYENFVTRTPLYDEAKCLADRLEKIEQTEVITH